MIERSGVHKVEEEGKPWNVIGLISGGLRSRLWRRAIGDRDGRLLLGGTRERNFTECGRQGLLHLFLFLSLFSSDLSHNEITVLDKRTFRGAEQLKHLWVHLVSSFWLIWRLGITQRVQSSLQNGFRRKPKKKEEKERREGKEERTKELVKDTVTGWW